MNREAIGYYQSISSSVETFCKPLKDYFGISLFIYFKIFRDSSYVMLTNDIQTTKEYCSKIDTENIHPYFQRYLENNTRSELILWPANPLTPGMQVFFGRDHWHGLTISIFNGDNIECCSFLGHKNNPQIIEFFLKYNSTFEKFAEHFKIHFIDIIAKSEQCKAKFNNGYDFYLPEYKIKNAPDIQAFLKATGIDQEFINITGNHVYLTLKEKKCLELMSQGHSLKGIGKKLLLSPRTIETHIYNVKKKTGHHYKYDLIQMYRDNFKS